jgi:hypothetical protein
VREVEAPARVVVMEEAGHPNDGSLLGDSAEVRAELEKIKEQVERGPGPLKLACFVVCAAALVVDAVTVLLDLFKVSSGAAMVAPAAASQPAESGAGLY